MPKEAHKFSESDIAAQAATIIAAMREARAQGRTVMFSCVIGSIPGGNSHGNASGARLYRQFAQKWIIS